VSQDTWVDIADPIPPRDVAADFEPKRGPKRPPQRRPAPEPTRPALPPAPEPEEFVCLDGSGLPSGHPNFFSGDHPRGYHVACPVCGSKVVKRAG
jgi:hypothetical protein